MWLFSWGSHGGESAYDINDHVVSWDGKSMWRLFKARKKGTGESLSVFRYDFTDPTEPNVEIARASLKRLKTLRHPSILKYIDCLEGEKSICIVTEPVRPLEQYIDEISDEYTAKQREMSISLGILNVAKGLNFLNNDCNLNHNNICINSIFVSSSGAWKIAGLEYICAIGDSPPSKPESICNKYNPPERLDQGRRAPSPKWGPDSWGLGCLVWESFNGPMAQNSSLKSIGKIPKSLSQHYNKLIQSNPKHRISPEDFIKDCRSSETFFNNSFIDAILFLEEIQIREASEKSKFFTNLENELDTFPTDMCRNKILPDLINAFEFGDAGSAILGPIFKIGKMLTDEEYQKKIVPCIIKLFACKDRATRAKLLQQIDTFIHLMQQNVINEQIFPQIAQGFLDSNVTIREQTIKSIMHIAPKLNYANLNEELMKHFGRLQTRDEDPGIRANTTICLGRIAKHLHTQVQQTILIPAFMRAMRDPFPPARSAAIMALANNESLFTVKDSATKIMPALCHLCIDADSAVRANSFRTLKQFLDKIEDDSPGPVEAQTAPVVMPPIKTANQTITKQTNQTKEKVVEEQKLPAPDVVEQKPVVEPKKHPIKPDHPIRPTSGSSRPLKLRGHSSTKDL